jgi:hypothetical protein
VLTRICQDELQQPGPEADKTGIVPLVMRVLQSMLKVLFQYQCVVYQAV